MEMDNGLLVGIGQSDPSHHGCIRTQGSILALIRIATSSELLSLDGNMCRNSLDEHPSLLNPWCVRHLRFRRVLSPGRFSNHPLSVLPLHEHHDRILMSLELPQVLRNK